MKNKNKKTYEEEYKEKYLKTFGEMDEMNSLGLFKEGTQSLRMAIDKDLKINYYSSGQFEKYQQKVNNIKIKENGFSWLEKIDITKILFIVLMFPAKLFNYLLKGFIRGIKRRTVRLESGNLFTYYEK